MQYDLIYFDVDETLVDRERRLLPGTVSALARARRLGARLGLATGRMLASARPYAEAIEAGAPLILYNGCRVQAPLTGEVLYSRELPLALARSALEILRGFDIHCNLYAGDSLYIDSITPRAVASMKKDGVEAEPVGDLVSFLQEDPVKLLLIGDGEELERFREEYTRHLPGLGRPELVRSEPTYLEILPAGASKGDALDRISAMTGVPLSRIAAFGDSYNDMEMLEFAGLGVAMGNSPDDVKARADVVTDTNERDGISKAMEEYIF